MRLVSLKTEWVEVSGGKYENCGMLFGDTLNE